MGDLWIGNPKSPIPYLIKSVDFDDFFIYSELENDKLPRLGINFNIEARNTFQYRIIAGSRLTNRGMKYRFNSVLAYQMGIEQIENLVCRSE